MEFNRFHEPLTAHEVDTVSTSHERLRYIDALKGFACLLVVLGHVAGESKKLDAYSNIKFLFNLCDGIYTFHMPLFMMISGFLFEKAYFQNSYRIDVRKRHLVLQTGNLLGIYIIFSFALNVSQIIFSKYATSKVTWTDFALILVRPRGHMWYIYVLLELYLTFSIPQIHKLPPHVLLPVLLLFNLLGRSSVESWFYIHYFFYYLLFFYTGMLFCARREHILFRKKVLAVFGILALALCILFWPQEQPVHTIPGVNMLVGMGFSLFLLNIFEKSSAISSVPLFQACQKYSLEIYLMHPYFIIIILILTQYLRISNIYLSTGLNFAISTVSPVIATIILKKLRLHTLFFKPATFIKNMREYHVNTSTQK